MAVENCTLELDREAVKAIRHALLVGLQSYGEIERVLDRIESASEAGTNVDGVLAPRHPTSDAGTILIFTAALALLN